MKAKTEEELIADAEVVRAKILAKMPKTQDRHANFMDDIANLISETGHHTPKEEWTSEMQDASLRAQHVLMQFILLGSVSVASALVKAQGRLINMSCEPSIIVILFACLVSVSCQRIEYILVQGSIDGSLNSKYRTDMNWYTTNDEEQIKY